MEYVMALLALGALCGCALGAYVLFEGMEREQETERARLAERALQPDGAMRWIPEQLVYPLTDGRGWLTPEPAQQHRRHGWVNVAARAERLDGRVRGLEDRLDRLVRIRAAAGTR